MDALRIQVPHELFAPAESSHFEGSIAIPVMKAGPDLYDFAGPLAWQADISNTGDALLVTGTVEGEAKTACARCLDEVSFPVTGEIEGYFLLDETKAAPEDMDEDEFEDDGYGEDDETNEAYGEPDYLTEDDFDDKGSK